MIKGTTPIFSNVRRHVFCAAALFVFCVPTFAQNPMPPESFVHQIQHNAAALEGMERVIFAAGRYSKNRVFEASPRLIDVIRSDSVLHPYLGKLHLVMVVGHSQPMETLDGAEASEVVRKTWNTGTQELMIFFAPGKSAWKLTRLQMRVAGKFEDLAPSEFANFIGDLLEDTVQVLETPVKTAPTRPVGKRPST